MDPGIIILILQAIIFAGFCTFLAQEKNRNEGSWMLLGLLFSIIALIAIAGAPVRELPKKKE